MLSKKINCLIALSAQVLSLVALFCVPLVNASNGIRINEEVIGVVVAFDQVLPTVTCAKVCETSLIVRIEKTNEMEPHYIRIDLEFPSYNRFPNELIKSKRRWRFKLKRTPALDRPIDEFIYGKSVFDKEFKLPVWKLIDRAKDERLPFGERLASYSLKKNGFKLIHED